MSAVLSFGGSSFRLPWPAVSVESHNWSKCREQVAVECPATNGASVPTLPRLREHCARKEARSRVRGWALQHPDLQASPGYGTRSLTASVWTRIRSVQDWTHQHPAMEKEVGLSHRVLTVMKDLCSSWLVGDRERCFLQVCCHWLGT